MKTKSLIPIFLAVAVGVAVCSILLGIRQSSVIEIPPVATPSKSALKPDQPSSPPVATAPATNDSRIEIPAPPLAVKVKTNATLQKPAPQPQRAAPPSAGQIQDPAARDALSYVGVDPDAEAYWIGSINNPDLPSDERRELIEDLNQDGFADTKNLTAEDLPLIMNRIQLIEDLAPYSMDQVNAEAFLEAYKDLLNMMDKLAAQ